MSGVILKDTQIAIKEVKDFFQRQLTAELNLHRVSAPLFVTPESGLNDNLNGVERPVKFGIKEQDEREVEIVHSLAKFLMFKSTRLSKIYLVSAGLTFIQCTFWSTEFI